jgi:integrase
MSIKQLPNGKWHCQIDRKGIPRTRKTFNKEVDAEIFERKYLEQYKKQQDIHNDKRTLTELIDIWYKYHGINLTEGVRRTTRLKMTASELGNPQASQLTAEDFVNYRYTKTMEGMNDKTINNIHGYLSALYNKLKKLNIIDYENPVGQIDFIKIQERQLNYLSLNQINILLDAIKQSNNESTWYVSQLCLRTGARWGEAESLRLKQLRDGCVTYEYTKSKKVRSIPLDDGFYKQLIKFAKGREPNDRIFKNCIKDFRYITDKTDLTFPQGQRTHILRHSFASHFIIKGGNIVTLQKILGHADIQTTMRYTHLSPSHLNDAIKLNPLA